MFFLSSVILYNPDRYLVHGYGPIEAVHSLYPVYWILIIGDGYVRKM